MAISDKYIEEVYAGWLGKVIGVRHGASIEGFSSEKIAGLYGDITGYLVNYDDFSADDDTTCPPFFLRALEDNSITTEITPQQIGRAWLNYSPYERSFFWFGGYGISTEHTAYLNLHNNIEAPRSGSLEMNGTAAAEQIGGQIFSDIWGLVTPGNPTLAADFARKASSVSHGGNGIFGGMFIAACVSAAFVEESVTGIILKALGTIPYDCEYARMVRDIIDFHSNNSGEFKKGLAFVKQKYGYYKYPGSCHIIPNAAIVVLSLLYGEGDFSNTINICCMCGWDTDCNAGNAGAIIGVKNSLEGIDYDKWRKPVRDFMAASSVVGCLNIIDIPSFALYIAEIGYRIQKEQPDGYIKKLLYKEVAKFNFELPGSTHGFRVKSMYGVTGEYLLENSTDYSHTGTRSLHICIPDKRQQYKIYHKTYYTPQDFTIAGYSPSFTPLVYPGQTIESYILTTCDHLNVCLYVQDRISGRIYKSEEKILSGDKWEKCSFELNFDSELCIEEIGFLVSNYSESGNEINVFIDDFDYYGGIEADIDLSKLPVEKWRNGSSYICGLDSYKGVWNVENNGLCGSCEDIGEIYTGDIYWRNYSLKVLLSPVEGLIHYVTFRTAGALLGYAAGFCGQDRFALMKKDKEYRVIKEKNYEWSLNRKYLIEIRADGNCFEIYINSKKIIEYKDVDNPYMKGMTGLGVQDKSACRFGYIKVKVSGNDEE